MSKTKIVKSKYKNVLANVSGRTIQFRNHEAEVDLATALVLISRPGYSLSHYDLWKTAKKICIARNMGIGDVLFVSTIASNIKRINPNCHLTFLTFNKHFRLLENHPYIDKVDDILKLGNQSYPDQFDYVMNFNNFFENGVQYEKGNSIHRVDMLRQFYRESPDKWDYSIYLYINNEEGLFAKKSLQDLRSKNLKIIGVVTQSTEITRRYPDNSKLISSLVQKGYGVVILSPGENGVLNHPNVLNMAGKTTLGQLIALIREVDLVITPDTGPLHIAGGLGKKIVTFFNSFPPMVRTRYYKNCFAFYPEEFCPRKIMPCGYSRCTAPCLRSISPEMFIRKIKEMI